MATKTCISKLADDILNDCNEQFGNGVEKFYYIIDREFIDWDKSKREDNIVTQIVLNDKAGARGYKIGNPSNETPEITVTDNNPAIMTSFEKSLPVVMLADSPKSAAAVMALKTNKYIVVYENTTKGDTGNQAFVVFGWENGASGRDLTLTKNSEDTLGGWAGTLVESKAPTAQIFFFMTDYQTTKEALESLCAPAEDTGETL